MQLNMQTSNYLIKPFPIFGEWLLYYSMEGSIMMLLHLVLTKLYNGLRKYLKYPNISYGTDMDNSHRYLCVGILIINLH